MKNNITYEQVIVEFNTLCAKGCDGCEYDDVGAKWQCALLHGFRRGIYKADVIEEIIEEIIEYYKPCNDCGACLEEDRDYFKKKCEMDMQISYTELVEDLEQLKEQKEPKPRDNSYDGWCGY